MFDIFYYFLIDVLNFIDKFKKIFIFDFILKGELRCIFNE